MRSPSLLLVLALPAASLAEHADVVIYGGTSAAVIATAVPHQLHRPTENRHTRTTFAPDLDP